jgi:mannose-6-phosphate isomerase-like protein (cupin superfamily)
VSDPYTLKQLTQVEDSAPKFGVGEVQEARFATDDLGAADTGVALITVKAGCRQAFAHKHDAAEEVYVVVSGSGRAKLDDDIVDVRTLDALRVAPGVMRQFEAGSDDLRILAFGPHHESDGEIAQDWWTD